jgi:hypothetical protein
MVSGPLLATFQRLEQYARRREEQAVSESKKLAAEMRSLRGMFSLQLKVPPLILDILLNGDLKASKADYMRACDGLRMCCAWLQRRL